MAERDDDVWAAATAAARSPAQERAVHDALHVLLADPQWTGLRLGFAFEPGGVRWQRPAHSVVREHSS
jgi:hypothetical protein